MFVIQCGKKQQDDRVCMGHFWICFVFEIIRKNRFSDPQKPEKSISVFKVFGKIDFHYAGEVTHPNPDVSTQRE